MTEGLIEREEPARLLLLAALSGEHALLLGPPGTAKSELARRLLRCVSGRYFERLLTKFSVPEELFGPLSLKSLERDEYRRLTDGYLPSTSVAFLDEIFNANSAILNALLTLLNEREFDNGAGRSRTPLICVVGASNQPPEGAELEALYDRFLLRYAVQPVSDGAFDRLLDAEPPRGEQPVAPLSPEVLEQIRREAASVTIPSCVRGVLAALRRGLVEQKIYASDRRWRKIASALRVAARCDGRTAVDLTDCWLAPHCLWSRPEQRPEIEALLENAVDSVLVDEPRRFETVVLTMEQQISREKARKEQTLDGSGQPLFLDEKGELTREPYLVVQSRNDQGQLLFLAPPQAAKFSTLSARSKCTLHELWDSYFRLLPDGMAQLESWCQSPGNQVSTRTLREPARGPASYAPEHIAARRKQLADLLLDVSDFQRSLATTPREGGALWVDPSRHRSVQGRMAQADERLRAISERLDSVIASTSQLAPRTP